jgi:hypothetical protein
VSVDRLLVQDGLRELVVETVNDETEIHDELRTLIASVDSRV